MDNNSIITTNTEYVNPTCNICYSYGDDLNKCNQCTLIICNTCKRKIEHQNKLARKQAACSICKLQKIENTDWCSPIKIVEGVVVGSIVINSIADHSIVENTAINEQSPEDIVPRMYCGIVYNTYCYKQFKNVIFMIGMISLCCLTGFIIAISTGDYTTIQESHIVIQLLYFSFTGMIVLGIIFFIVVCCIGCFINIMSLGISESERTSVAHFV